MGRPPRDPETVRRHRVTTTFTDAELESLTALAESRGVPVGTVMHELVVRALKRKRSK
jgi:hypothetical protein